MEGQKDDGDIYICIYMDVYIYTYIYIYIYTYFTKMLTVESR
jgi:hypothetical protein